MDQHTKFCWNWYSRFWDADFFSGWQPSTIFDFKNCEILLADGVWCCL